MEGVGEVAAVAPRVVPDGVRGVEDGGGEVWGDGEEARVIPSEHCTSVTPNVRSHCNTVK